MEQNLWPAAAGPGSALDESLSAMHAWFSRLARSETQDSPAQEAARMHVLLAFLCQIALDPSTGSHMAPSDPAFRALTAAIERDFDIARSVGHCARELNYAPRTLNRLAQKYAGVTVKELIDRRVILEAKRLLAHGSDSSAAVAKSLGFDDAANFAAYFQHRTSQTPGQFRAHRQGDHAATP